MADTEFGHILGISPGANVLAQLMNLEKKFVANNDEKLSCDIAHSWLSYFPTFFLAVDVLFEITNESTNVKPHLLSFSGSAGACDPSRP